VAAQRARRGRDMAAGLEYVFAYIELLFYRDACALG
jgi:hypothetical protein